MSSRFDSFMLLFKKKVTAAVLVAEPPVMLKTEVEAKVVKETVGMMNWAEYNTEIELIFGNKANKAGSWNGLSRFKLSQLLLDSVSSWPVSGSIQSFD